MAGVARVERAWMRRKACWASLAMALVAALAAATSADPAFVARSGDSETVVDIPDAALRKAVEAALGKSDGDPVTRGEMATLARLDARRGGVRQLTGMEYAINLEWLDLLRNDIADLSPLSGLTSLEFSPAKRERCRRRVAAIDIDLSGGPPADR